MNSFSDDESESNTTATSAASSVGGGLQGQQDQRTLRAQKRQESMNTAAAAQSSTPAPIVRGRNRPKSPANSNSGVASNSGSGSNIVVQKAMVRSVFEQYCEAGEDEDEEVVTPQGLQELCVDYGTFLPLADILTAMKNIDANFDGVFQYEEFMVWWRNNPFRCVIGLLIACCYLCDVLYLAVGDVKVSLILVCCGQ